MTHFKEIINTVSKTTKLSKRQLCFQLGISQELLMKWQRAGPPKYKIPLIMDQLKNIVKENTHGVNETKNPMVDRGRRASNY